MIAIKNKHVIKCSNGKEVIYFCKDHCTTNDFIEKIKNSSYNKLIIQDIKYAYGILCLSHKGLTLKIFNYNKEKSEPITYIQEKISN